MSDDKKKSKSMTIFKSDRHEDWAAIFCAAAVVAVVLIYMAYFVPEVVFKAPADGKILAIKVLPNAVVKKGDSILTMEVTEKKMVHGVMEEKVVEKEFPVKLDGTVMKVLAKEGDSAKKDKDTLMVFAPVRGRLP